MLFENAYNEWKIYVARRHKKQGLDTLIQNFNKHILPYFKNKYIENLTIQDFISWQNSIIDFNFSNNYNRNIYQSFNSFVKYCLLNSYLKVNYLLQIGSFNKKIEFKEYNIYTKKDFKKFRKGLTNIIYKYFFDLLFYYGLRSGEAMALKLSNLRGKNLFIGSSMVRRGNREILSAKTKNSNRFLKLSFIMRFKLLVLKCMYVKKYCDEGYDYFIFGGKKPLSPTSITRYKHNACKKMNIFEITTHEFRHSYATREIKKGLSVDILSKRLGHSSVSITYDIYVHQEKRTLKVLSSNDFFNTLIQNLKKILLFIITRFIV